jgi:hypothetical protein
MDLLALLGILAIGSTAGGLVLTLRASLGGGDEDGLVGRAPTFEVLDPAFQHRAVAAVLGRSELR